LGLCEDEHRARRLALAACCNAGATSTLGVHGEAPGAGPNESTFTVEIDDLRTGHLLCTFEELRRRRQYIEMGNR
jgi:hypothetical protein